MQGLLPLLLRVLLGVSLIFNGTAYSMGGLQVPAHSMAAADMHPGGSCHHHGSMDAHPAADTGHPGNGHPAGACCKTGACACASQPTVPVVATLALHETAIERIDAPPLVSGHVPPVLAGLIRPPIA